MDKFKVINDNPFVIGMRFFDNREVVIRPKSFTLLSDTDIHYVNSISKLFQEGTIYCEDENMMIEMGYVEKNTNVITEEEIKNIFKGSVAKIKEALLKITAKHAIDKVIEIAKQSDLPASKISVIEEVFGGRKVFDDITNDIS